MLSSDDYEALAKTYGRVGGMDRMATLVKAIRAERGAERVLLLDGGDALQGSYTALADQGRRHGRACCRRWAWRRPPAIGSSRWALTASPSCSATSDRPGSSGLAFLAGNVRDTDFDEPVFHPLAHVREGRRRRRRDRPGIPYTPIANPRWMMPDWSFGIREAERAPVGGRGARRQGAQVVVLLSHNGFDVDRKLAARVEGIDVILTAHTHDALPAARAASATRCWSPRARTASSCRASIVEVDGGRVKDFAYALIPVLADAIAPDPGMARADRRHPRAARGDAGDRARPAPRRCSTAAARSAARSTT